MDKNKIILIDKPYGVTSHKVVSILRKKLDLKKIGHAGTLDPSASGLLICCVGKATKISQYLMGQNKTYEVDVVLGATSSTYDDEGELTNITSTTPSKEMIEKCVLQFVGKIKQKPPIYSAIKIKGQKLYQYARKGIEVEIQPRSITVFNIQVQSIEKNIVSLLVHCEKGTYIRSLAHDIGQSLGCGGYAKNIRRLQSGDFSLAQAKPLNQVLEMSAEEIVSNGISIFEALTKAFICIEVNETQVVDIRNGKKLHGLPAMADGMVLFHTANHEAIAIAQSQNQEVTLKRVF